MELAANEQSVHAAFMGELQAGGWRMLVAGLVGVALGLTALPFYTLGVFAGPVAQEFGWARADVLSGLLFSMLGTVCAAGLTGWAIDRYGARRVAILCQFGLAAGFGLLANQPGNPTVWRASWFLMAVMGIGTTPLTWSTGIADWFTRGRGMALGIALSGSGITAMLAPPLLQAVIDAHGWRVAYLVMAGAVLLVALPITLLLFRPRGGAAGEVVDPATLPGLEFHEALRGYRFWLIVAAFAAISFGIGGAIPNLVPMLQEAGVANAAFYASIVGAMVIAGRLLAGFLLDRFWAPAVAVLLLGVPALACILLALQIGPGLSAALVGLVGGAEFDLIAFLCARYFGKRAFGRIYAWQWASFALAAGFGSYAFAATRDVTGSYTTALYIAAALMAGGGLSLLGLGRYPDFGDGAATRRW
ncbi:MFS transporter [Sandaracinobacteroides hominis]|uniref:MFS transporter n=1 Tax=Sandaracinobacteroides hominis TaxID=2780086 RepID=UPI0018F73FF8|nr:MFS transporter [Sandaracinobacteroides hominis]